MCRSRLGLFAVVCFLAVGGCTTGSGSGSPQATGSACFKACDAEFEANTLDCTNHPDNVLCSKECLDKLESCKKKCE